MRRAITRLANAREGRSGAAAVEFALILPAFVMLIVGAMFTAQMMYAASSLRYATEAAARCASINTGTCSSNSATQTYAASKYTGPASPAPTFVSSSAACGHNVTGSIAYVLDTGVTRINVPLSAAACFP
jgi:Flp pilus assembly protein TadG